MSEGTTKPNGSGEMHVITGADEEVKKRVDKYDIKVTAVTAQFLDRKIRSDEITNNGDPINKVGDFVLVSNPKEKDFDGQEIADGNKGKAKVQDKNAKDKRRMATRKAQSKKDPERGHDEIG